MFEYKGYKPHPNGWAVTPERMAQYDRENRLHYPASPVDYIVGFPKPVTAKEIEKVLLLLLKRTDANPVMDIVDDIEELRQAIPCSEVQFHYLAHTKQRAYEYVHTDQFPERVGVEFKKFLRRHG